MLVSTIPAASGRSQRRLRNYLLDRHFQLKYTSYLVGIALFLSICLGAILWNTSQAVIAESRRAVQQGENVVVRGREVVAESQKVSAVVQMNIVKDPVYGDNPALHEAFMADAAKQDERLLSQQRSLEAQARALKEQTASIEQRQSTMLITLLAALGVLVALIGVAGIVVTHHVAGPVYKIKRMVREVADGRLPSPSRLRRGDELVDFFQAFESMVASLRLRRERDLEQVGAVIDSLDGQLSAEQLAPLTSLRDSLRESLKP